MTDQVERVRTIDLVRETLDRRYRAERHFQLAGLVAIILGLMFLVIMFTSIIGNGYTAFFQHYVQLDVTYDPDKVDPEGDASEQSLRDGNYGALVKQTLRTMYPGISGRRDKKQLYGLVSGGANYELRDRLVADPKLLGKEETLWFSLDDDADMFMKGHMTDIIRQRQSQQLLVNEEDGALRLQSESPVFATIAGDVRKYVERRLKSADRQLEKIERDLVAEGESDELLNLKDQAKQSIERLKAILQKPVTDKLEVPAEVPSYLVQTPQGYLEITAVAPDKATAKWLLQQDENAASSVADWQVIVLTTPQADRRMSNKPAAILLSMQDQGLIESRFNTTFFTAGDSREPEQSGILSALKGSMYKLIVTLLLSFPIGVASAVYLEEFAPQNRWTDFIEVNINNLAAVPSIVFGLLGLAVFINFFTLPRSAPLVGGLVLTLMTLPTIIISGRAALKSVPPSIREAALGIGASKVQTVFYHVLPLALPGMLTGTIIGMAQALGESAPLLMIGMVAVIVDVPQGFTDPSTALPVQIYLWADSPERAFVERTSAAIMVLLAFLVAMNALAVFLRKRFERRW